MSAVRVSYSGDKTCLARDAKSGKQIVSDCSMTKGKEFGPESLVAAGLGSCMLITMSSYAERHGLDVTGAQTDVAASLGGKPGMRITKFDITVRVPRSFTDDEMGRLTTAANTCPIKNSFGSETEISTHFEFGDKCFAAA